MITISGNLNRKARVKDIPPAVKMSVQLDNQMSQLLIQDGSSGPENHMKPRNLKDYFKIICIIATIPSFTQTTPVQEAASPVIPAASAKYQLLILAWFWDIYLTCRKQKVGFCFTI